MAPIEDDDEDDEDSRGGPGGDWRPPGDGDVIYLDLHVGPPLGEGTSGEVSPLLHSIDGGRYAVKEVKRKPGDREEVDAAVLHEVRLHRLCSAECSAVVRYAFSYCTEEALLVVMEACDCVLWDAITRDRDAWLRLDPGSNTSTVPRPELSLRERLAITEELAGALRHCHELRVLHRDVNPWNVFLVRAPAPQGAPRQLSARLGDFGLAAQLPLGTEVLKGMEAEGAAPLDDSAVGSLYSAPELGRVYGFPADVFSLGMTLLALWASADASSSEEEALTILVEAVKLSASVDQPAQDLGDVLKELRPGRPRLRSLLLAAVSAWPGDRPTMREACTALRAASRESAEEPGPSGAEKAAGRPRRSMCCCCLRRRGVPVAPGFDSLGEAAKDQGGFTAAVVPGGGAARGLPA